MLDFRILGPLEIRDGPDVVPVGGVKQRSVLALLLLSANEVVSSDRLIDRLWGDAPPEDASMALQAHVSRLRKALPNGPSTLLTQPPGYVLRVEPERVDLHRFQEGVRRGRALLDAGEADVAAGELRAALDLWRGRPLADLEDEPFARVATAHLEDAWLDALGVRIDADLAGGRHAELVPELRALVQAHPLREGLREQLMLALYRAGRQADALDVFTDARRQLNDELGLEPGPALQRLQQRILVQDPELDWRSPPAAGDAPRRGWAMLVVAAAAAASAVIVAASVLASGGGGPPLDADAGALLELDAVSGTVGTRTPLGRIPTAVTIGEGGIWVLDADARTVTKFDPAEKTISTFATGSTPTDIAAGGGAVWVGNGTRLSSAQFIGPVATSAVRIDPSSMTERAEVALPRTGGALSNLVENHLAATDGALWAVAPDFSLARIDAGSSAITAVVRPFPVQAVAAGPAGVWVLGTDGTVALLDARSGNVRAQVRVPATSVGGIAVGTDAAWVTSPSDGTLWRVDATGEKPTLGSIDVGAGAADVAVGDDHVWVANPLVGVVIQVAIANAAVARTIPTGGVPRSIAVDGERVWVSLSNPEKPAVGVGDVAGVRPLPATSCEPVRYGGDGEPDLLIASDLMLQGGARVLTTQMAQAIEFVLRERGFRAGSYRVAYQSCDDSIATTGLSDPAKCAANARAYAGNPDVLGVVGTFNSSCAVDVIPILNRAPGGGLALIGPTTSSVGLTRAGPGAPAESLARLYPTGTRNFVRVFPGDDMQMAALALTVRRLGHDRVALLDDGEPGYGLALALGFERASRRLGLEIVFRESWDPQARSYRGLVQALQRSRAQAVVLSGLLDTNGPQVVRELRAQLGPDVDLLGSDGFTPVGLLLERAGEAGRGMYVSVSGLTLERLGPVGKRFVRSFAATQPGAEIQPSTVYAAQAAEVLLDAIARSDGTRASVIRELFATNVEGGMLGDFTFDENGDIAESPITILRAERPGGSNTIQSFEGARIVRIERPSAALVR